MRPLWPLALGLLATACPSPPPPPPPAVDAGAPDVPIAAPEAPRLGPCPSGWRALSSDGGDERWCEPWPDGGWTACASAAEALFPGEPGCARLGSLCPAGEWPEGLPDASVRYVRAGGGDGGTGSPVAPFGTIAEAAAGAPAGTVIALGRGTYDEVVHLPAGVTLWGACVEGTVVTSSMPSESAGVLNPLGRGTMARNLTVSGRRPGVWVDNDAAVRLEDVLVDQATFGGWILLNGGTGSARGLVIRRTRPRQRDLKFGQALHLEQAGLLDVSRAVFEHNHDIGVSVSSGRPVTLTDVAIVDTAGRLLDGHNGRGLNLQNGATAALTRVVVEQSRDMGLVAQGWGSALTGTDVVIRDGLGQDGTGDFGRGVDVQAGSHLSLARALVERNRDVGIIAAEAVAVAELTDVLVRDTVSRASDGAFGRGLHAQDGAQVTATRVRLARNREAGVFAHAAGTRVTLTDVSITDTTGRASNLSAGAGLTVQDGAVVEANRAELARNRRGGIFAMGPGSWVRLTDVVVRDTRVEDCAATTCADLPFGTAIGAYQGAAIAMSRFVVSQSPLCGLQLAGGTMVAETGQVRGNTIGVCVADPTFDFQQLSSGVVFLDNGTRLDSRTLPLPGSLSSH